MGQSRPLFRLFSVFSSVNTIFIQNIKVKNDRSCMRHWDSNSGPLGHESPPLTIRPGLSPKWTLKVAYASNKTSLKGMGIYFGTMSRGVRIFKMGNPASCSITFVLFKQFTE